MNILGINLANQAKITELLDRIQAKSRTRTIDYADMLERTNKVVDHLGITKKALIGTKVIIDVCAQKFPHAYKYTPESTIFEAVYLANGWRVLDIYRGECKPNGNHIILSDTAKEALIDKAEKADWL